MQAYTKRLKPITSDILFHVNAKKEKQVKCMQSNDIRTFIHINTRGRQNEPNAE